MPVLRLVRVIRSQRVALLHVHSDVDRKVGQLAALIAGVPVVGHLHSPSAHLEPLHTADARPAVQWLSRLKAGARRWVERRTVVRYVAAGDAVAQFHAHRLGAPIVVVNNGVDSTRFVVSSGSAREVRRRALGLPADAPLLVFVGRLAVGKGQDTLLRALPGLPSSQLLLLGDGPQRRQLEQLARQLGVAGRVVFAGDRTDVADLLAAADVFVMASVSEGLPLSVLEAMACGVPVVAFDLPGLRAVITDRVDGRLVEWGSVEGLTDAVTKLLEDPDRRAAMGAAARRTVVDRFDASSMTRQVEAVYAACLGTELEQRGAVDADCVVLD